MFMHYVIHSKSYYKIHNCHLQKDLCRYYTIKNEMISSYTIVPMLNVGSWKYAWISRTFQWKLRIVKRRMERHYARRNDEPKIGELEMSECMREENWML